MMIKERIVPSTAWLLYTFLLGIMTVTGVWILVENPTEMEVYEITRSFVRGFEKFASAVVLIIILFLPTGYFIYQRKICNAIIYFACAIVLCGLVLFKVWSNSDVIISMPHVGLTLLVLGLLLMFGFMLSLYRFICQSVDNYECRKYGKMLPSDEKAEFV